MNDETPPDYDSEFMRGGLPTIARIYIVKGETVVWYPDGSVVTLVEPVPNLRIVKLTPVF